VQRAGLVAGQRVGLSRRPLRQVGGAGGAQVALKERRRRSLTTAERRSHITA